MRFVGEGEGGGGTFGAVASAVPCSFQLAAQLTVRARGVEQCALWMSGLLRTRAMRARLQWSHVTCLTLFLAEHAHAPTCAQCELKYSSNARHQVP